MTHSFLPNFSRLVSGGAEEAGMNGGALTPKRAKARFARLSRGVAPQVPERSTPTVKDCGGHCFQLCAAG